MSHVRIVAMDVESIQAHMGAHRCEDNFILLARYSKRPIASRGITE